MITRISLGLFVLALGVSETGLYSIPSMITGIIGIVAGIAVLVGV